MAQPRRRVRKNPLADRLAERWQHGQELAREPMLRAPHQVASRHSNPLVSYHPTLGTPCVKSYGRAVAEFLAWCDEHGVPSVAAVQPLHVAAWIGNRRASMRAPIAKLRLAGLRHLFDRLVTGQVVLSRLAPHLALPDQLS